MLDFNRDVRPLLADNCFSCHGRDANQRKAGLRLDVREEALAKGAIVPGDAVASELVRRITAAAPEDLMPPPESKRSLAPEQTETLIRWIDEGAEYLPHWAFIPLGEVAVPTNDASIDAFVHRRLEQEGLEPAPGADKETLLRRVSLALTGLPPTLEEIDAFLADDSADAYEKVVDRLLASQAYGERMALDWLDVARYADTFGYQNDVEMRVWPWRDWVIEAFNSNLPYDQFVTQQLAGDLIPNATPETTLATAFNRLHRQTNEGGSIDEEFRVEYVADRVHTFATAFLGLTMDCARCHDHKFDPISQKEYYQTFAFFDDIDESGLYSHFTNATPTPSMPLMTAEDRALRKKLDEAVAAAEDRVERERHRARERFRSWLADPARPVPEATPLVHLPLDGAEDGKTANTADEPNPATVEDGIGFEAGLSGQAARFDGDHKLRVPDAGQFERTQPFTLAMWLKSAAHPGHMVVAHCSEASLDAASRGYELLLEDGRPTFALNHFWPGDALRVEARAPIPAGEWVHVAVTYDGMSRASGVALFVNGRQVAVDVVRDNLTKTIRYDDENVGKHPPLTLGARFRDSGFAGGLIDEFRVYQRALAPLEVAALAGQQQLAGVVAARAGAGNAPVDADLFAYYLAAVDKPYAGALATRQTMAEALNTFVSAIPEIMVMQDTPEPRQAYVLARGAYDARAEAVEPGTPENILPLSDDLPRNRLGLAQWLLDPKHPLTARVAVNRYWQMHFGRGLVETQEDFGTQGRPPTHPELLDWLARWFIDSGWDVKALHTLIVTSATFRQDSAPRPELIERDPLNTLLARGPRLRLPAETVRDSALAASGLLVAKIGGPSVKPYQPGDLWRDASQVTYEQDTGEGLYRRSMYTYWKRTVPPPTMLTFDAPSREFCLVRREVTATPLQSLILLNDPQYVEAARMLATNVIELEPEDVEARLLMTFRALTSRRPDENELVILRRAYEEQAALYAESEDAVKYASVGQAPRREELDAAVLAATTAVVQMIMNLNEFQVNY
jgi:hypothetical protein